jgi:hypothetical protein
VLIELRQRARRVACLEGRVDAAKQVGLRGHGIEPGRRLGRGRGSENALGRALGRAK